MLSQLHKHRAPSFLCLSSRKTQSQDSIQDMELANRAKSQADLCLQTTGPVQAQQLSHAQAALPWVNWAARAEPWHTATGQPHE